MNTSTSFRAGSIEHVLHTIPILQIIHSFFVICALPPVLMMIWFLRRIALHVNCQFLLYTWLFAFVLLLLSHGAYVTYDLASGKYIPSFAGETEFRSYSLAVHGFAHAFSSIQELLFSIERAFACANPSKYHDRSFSKIPIFVSELVGIGLASLFSYLLKIGNDLLVNNSDIHLSDKLILGCIMTNVIDVLSLVCLVSTTIWTNIKKKKLLLCGLNEKYQVKEAFETTRVMLPCGVISLIMKLCAMAAAWTFGLKIIQSTFAFTVTSGVYLIIETTNCFICSVVFLTNHIKLRKKVSRAFCERKVQVNPLSEAIQLSADLHFDTLRNNWEA